MTHKRFEDLPTAKVRIEVQQVQQRLVSLRQLLLFSFYLFCFCFFILLRISFHTVGETKSRALSILEGFYLYFGFAADVCLLFLFLHTLLWAISKRVDGELLKETKRLAATE